MKGFDEAGVVEDAELVSDAAATDVMSVVEVADEILDSVDDVLLAELLKAIVGVAPPSQSSSGPWLMLKCDDTADSPRASTTTTCAASPAVKANTQSTVVSSTNANFTPLSALAVMLYGAVPPDQERVVAWHWTTF